MHIDVRIILAYLCVCIGFSINAEKNDSTFVPTHKWQTVKKGTPIPGGLHIRHNFQTGVTEAKLLDDTEVEGKGANDTSNPASKSLTLHPDKTLSEQNSESTLNVPKNHEPLKYTLAELKAKLKNIKQKENDLQDGKNISSKDAKVKNDKAKSRKINVTNDAEVLNKLFQNFETLGRKIATGTLDVLELSDVLYILNNLEYLIHQIDNAQLFSDIGGLSKIISPCLNGTNDEVKAEALRLLGAAVQSNPNVQAKALELELIQRVLHILSVNSKTDVRSRCLFALSALIRHYPAAQKTLIDHGGLELFGKILMHDVLQLQIKVMRLIHDLLVERHDLEKLSDLELQRTRRQEYRLTEFEEKLVMQKYCQRLSYRFVKSLHQGIFNADGFLTINSDFLEAVCQNMIIVTPICKYEFKLSKKELLAITNDIINVYHEKYNDVNKNENDFVRMQLITLIKELKEALSNVHHDEL